MNAWTVYLCTISLVILHIIKGRRQEGREEGNI